MSDEDSKLDSLLRKVGKAPPRQLDAHFVDEQRYELGPLLGEGSFGAVYEAYDRKHERPIALKILRRTSSEALLRFKREFRVLAELSDPSLAALFDLHGEGERWYFTMERIVGVPFDEWVRDPERLRPALAALGDALTRLHARGVVHRDLKPSNVLVDGSGRVVLLDFGLLHLLDTEGSTVIAGTPSTIAPEVAAGRAPSPASDWYAVGVMLHEALTGVAPFAGTADEVLRQKQGAAPPPVRTRAESAPPDLAELCDRLLEPNPVTRGRVLEVDVPGVARAPFVGRAAELDALDRALGDCPGVVRIYGSSGIGKTALVQRFAERARDAGARVLSSRCHLRDHVPFVALDGVIDELARLLARLPPAHARAIAPRDADALVRAFPVLRAIPGFDRPAGGDGARARVAAALGDLLGRWGDRAPWVVVIDDAQWGDADSAAILGDLVRDKTVRLCLVLVHRRDARGPLIDAFADAGLIEVRGLDGSDARALLGQVTDLGDVDAIVRDAGGHPLFLIELARARAGSDDQRSFAEVVRGRMALLEPAAAWALRMLAIAASPVPIGVLAEAGVTRASIEALREQGFVAFHDDETVATYHDRIRDVVHDAIDADAARGLHRELALAMESLVPEHAEALAFHFEAAGMLERAASHLRRAATAATATRAFAQSRSIYARLLALRELAAIHDGQDLELREEAAMASARAGMSVEAAEGFLACAQLAGPERALSLRVRAAEHLLDSGHRERGEAILDGELAQLGTSIPTTDVGRVLGIVRDTVGRRLDRVRPRPTSEQRLSLLWTACRSAMAVHPVRATSLATRFMREAERPGTNAHARLAAAFLRGFGEVGPRGPLALPKALGGIERAFEDRSDPVVAQLHALCEALLLYFGFELHRSRASFDRCVRIGVEHGLGRTFEETFARCVESSAAWVLGDIDGMRANVPSLCAELDERDHLIGWIMVEMHRIWLVGVEKGLTPGWDATIERVRSRWRTRGPELQGWFLDIGNIYKALTLRDGRTAWKLSLPQARRFQERVFSTLLHRVEAQTFLVRAGIQIALQERTPPRAELARCHAVVEEMAEIPSAWTRAHSLCLGAGLASVEGDRVLAVRSLRAALPNLREAGMPNMLALAESALGRLVGGDEGRALEEGMTSGFDAGASFASRPSRARSPARGAARDELRTHPGPFAGRLRPLAEIRGLSGWRAPYVLGVLPDAFGSQKTLARLNVAAVAFALAACTGATFGALFEFPGGLVALPTFFCGLLWAAMLRIPKTLGRSGLRWGWLASVPLAALNGGLACGVLFVAEPNADLASIPVGIVLGATVGVLFWGPALTVTLLCFGVPIAWAQRLAARGLAGTERGERIVGAVCAVLGALACVVAHEGMGATAHGIDHSSTQLSSGAAVTQLAGAIAFVLGSIAVALATRRERRRATFVAQVEAGAVPRFRIDHAVEGKVLVRIESQGRGAYRVADYEEEICLLDQEGAATRVRTSA